MAPQELKGRQVTVVGGARSGFAVARLLAGAGARVFLTDKGEPSHGLPESLDALGIAHEFGGHTPRALQADLMVISPGVPSTAHLIQQALRTGVPVVSEIEVASWFCRAPIVAITGSNGKTTTTSLIGHIFRESGRGTYVAGNIGFPFSDYVADATADDVVVLEVSSFQLDHVAGFRPRVSVLLNITPDHMDRYDHDFNRYAASKVRIYEAQGEGDVLVYNHDDVEVRSRVEASGAPARLTALAISQEQEVPLGAFVRGGMLVLRLPEGEETLMPLTALALPGKHNLYNSMAAALATRAMGVAPEAVREGLAGFEGVPHRLEFVREVDGVRYVNDSKATNVDAVWYALQSFDRPIVLIAGGKDKGNDYAPLRPLLEGHARGVVAIGESAEKVERELGPSAPVCVRAASMEEAIGAARRMARPGDVVLLSPACASFDMFKNYEDRGDVFRRLVQSL